MGQGHILSEYFQNIFFEQIFTPNFFMKYYQKYIPYSVTMNFEPTYVNIMDVCDNDDEDSENCIDEASPDSEIYGEKKLQKKARKALLNSSNLQGIINNSFLQMIGPGINDPANQVHRQGLNYKKNDIILFCR